MRPWKLHHVSLIALLACTICLHAAPAPKPVPVLLDTDIGSDIDDAFAIALILHSPELDLRAVTTASGDTDARARLAAKCCGWMGAATFLWPREFRVRNSTSRRRPGAMDSPALPC